MSIKRDKLEVNYFYVDSDIKLSYALSKLIKKAIIGVDTESDPQRVTLLDLSLVQIGDQDQQFLFDPLAIDITKLSPLFENPDILKVFFAGNQDILIIKFNLKCEIYSYFDLQLAYRWLNHSDRDIGLAGLINVFFNDKIPKEEQLSKWQKRPLTESMLVYAGRDVLYLPLLKGILEPLLEENGLMKKVSFVFECVQYIRPVKREVIQQTGYFSIKNFRTLNGEGKLIAKRLYNSRNVFTFRLANETIYEIATEEPSSINQVKSIIKRISDKDAKKIVYIVSTSKLDLLNSSNIYYQEIGRLEELGRFNFDLLKEDLTPVFSISIKQFTSNYKRLHQWVSEKKKLLSTHSDLIIPSLILRELALEDFLLIQITSIYYFVIDHIQDSLKTEFSYILGYKEIEFFRNFIIFINEHKNSFPEAFNLIKMFDYEYHTFNTYLFMLSKGISYRIIADTYNNTFTTIFSIGKELCAIEDFIKNVKEKNSEKSLVLEFRETDRNLFIESSTKLAMINFLEIASIVNSFIDKTSVYENFLKS